MCGNTVLKPGKKFVKIFLDPEDSYKRKDIESRFLALCKVMQIYNSED